MRSRCLPAGNSTGASSTAPTTIGTRRMGPPPGSGRARRSRRTACGQRMPHGRENEMVAENHGVISSVATAIASSYSAKPFFSARDIGLAARPARFDQFLLLVLPSSNWSCLFHRTQPHLFPSAGPAGAQRWTGVARCCQEQAKKKRLSGLDAHKASAKHMAVGQSPVPLVNVNIGGKWMFIHPQNGAIGYAAWPHAVAKRAWRIWSSGSGFAKCQANILAAKAVADSARTSRRFSRPALLKRVCPFLPSSFVVNIF